MWNTGNTFTVVSRSEQTKIGQYSLLYKGQRTKTTNGYTCKMIYVKHRLNKGKNVEVVGKLKEMQQARSLKL